MPRPEPQRYARDPWAELTPEERTRAKRRLLHRLQAGGIVFLAVVVLGLLPAVAAKVAPGLGRAAAVAAWFVAPVLGAGLVVFALLRLRR
ncbi:MAG TPA: hypothetical protein VF841_06420 [Anaeromyxobacter sp.]